MPHKILKVGDTTSTGHVVAEVLGQGPAGAVYIATNDEIRWHYYKNRGVLPDQLGATVARFNTILADIRAINVPLTKKRGLYDLAGKSLYLAFTARSLVQSDRVFADVEERVAALSKAVSGDVQLDPARRADLVIVCALHEPELQAVLALSAQDEAPTIRDDPQTYHATTWTTTSGARIRVVLAAPNQMGLTAAGILTAKMLIHFRPKLVVMAGIAAGTKADDQGFGDIVAPEQTFDYGAGKSVEVAKHVDLLPNPNPLPINPKLLGRLKEWRRTRQQLEQIAESWPAARPRTRLGLHTGPMFSASTVLQTRKPIDQAMKQWRKLAAVEMEAYAVHRACTDTVEPSPLFLCAKSLCDFAAAKTDDWQHYAAHTSARFVYEFVRAEWTRLISD